MRIALIQLTSGANIAANIAKIETLVKQAAGQGAELVALPENAFYMRAEGEAAAPKYTQVEHPGVAAAARMAKENHIWLLAGSVAVKNAECTGLSAEEENNPGLSTQHSALTYNRSILFNPEGEIAAQYDKIHLFDVDVGDGQTYRESARILPGEKAVVVRMDVERWRCEDVVKKENSLSSHPHILTSPHPALGLTICYDLRFPQLYRALAKAGAQILAVPSAFTVVTGEAHWHVLLRARAIENGCFVIAPAQTGTHPGNRKTYGHSLIVDPWGKILADGGTEEGVVMAEIDLDEVKRVRTKLPSLEHDREFA